MTPFDWTLFFLAVLFFISKFRIKNAKERLFQKQGGEMIETEYFNSIKPPIICNTELIDNQIYVWNKETNVFLIQSKTMDGIVEYFTKNYPGRKIVLVENKNND